jgi:hypothetical protein
MLKDILETLSLAICGSDVREEERAGRNLAKAVGVVLKLFHVSIEIDIREQSELRIVQVIVSDSSRGTQTRQVVSTEAELTEWQECDSHTCQQSQAF